MITYYAIAIGCLIITLIIVIYNIVLAYIISTEASSSLSDNLLPSDVEEL